jgi:hypothetical protein
MFGRLLGKQPQPQPKPPEPFNRECPICLREREPYMMTTLNCNHRACKEHLNFWGWQNNSRTIQNAQGDIEEVYAEFSETLPTRCPFCNQDNMVPRPYLHRTEFNTRNNVLGLTPEEWDDDWNDWRWEEYDRQIDLYTREKFEYDERSKGIDSEYFVDNTDPWPEYAYLEIIADRVLDAEKRRNQQIHEYLYAKQYPKYANLQPDQELRYKRMIENRRELRSLGFEPKEARQLSRQIENGEITLDSLRPRQPMFRFPISGASGGGSKRGRKLKKRKHHKSKKRK